MLADLVDEYLAALAQDEEARGAQETAATPGELLARELPQDVPPRVGDVWRVAGEGDQGLPWLLMLTWVATPESPVCRGLLVLDEPWMAGAEDVLVDAADSPTDSTIVLCIWRELPLARSSLKGWVGPVPAEVAEAATMLLQNRATGGFSRVPRGLTRVGSMRAMLWAITPVAAPGRSLVYLSGPRLAAARDPRGTVRARLTELTAHLEHQAIDAAEAHAGELAAPAAAPPVLRLLPRRSPSTPAAGAPGTGRLTLAAAQSDESDRLVSLAVPPAGVALDFWWEFLDLYVSFPPGAAAVKPVALRLHGIASPVVVSPGRKTRLGSLLTFGLSASQDAEEWRRRLELAGLHAETMEESS
jgi:hypothetical protein